MMLSKPIPYTASIEERAQDEDNTIEKLQRAAHQIQTTMEANHGVRLRGAHAKGQALLKARLTVLGDLPPELAQGLFAAPGIYNAVMRFSTAPGDILHDGISGPRGLALKILDVDGKRLPDTPQEDGQDFLLVNGPVFPNASPKRFLKGFQALAKTTDKAPRAKRALSATLQTVEAALEAIGLESTLVQTLGGAPDTQPLGDIFFTQVPYRYGDYVAKLSVAPVSPHLTALADEKVDTGGRPDAIREDINAVVTQHGGTWELRVQLRTDADTMPIEDPTVEWDETKSPFAAVARLEAAPQTGWDYARDEEWQADLAFSPWHGLEAHRPLGGIGRARKAVYERSQAFRSAENQCPMHSVPR